MLPHQPALTARPHRNQRLFSDHYLDVVLPGAAEWKAHVSQAAASLSAVAGVYASFVPSTREAQTEQDLIRPVLDLLGHIYEVQPSLKTPGTPQTPDYVLYRDAAAVNANKGRLLDDTMLPNALAVADAKHWDRPLDQALHVGKDPFTNKNPGYQISFYVQHSGLPWGILTNGRLWRLYHRDTAHKLDVFYEVNLPELVESGDAARFQYFLRFFERAAFEEGPLSLTQHLSASAGYSRSVGQGLREQVYEALLHVAQGFLDFPRNGLSPDSAVLKEIYNNALIVLYRLLFVLYAEARGLLPVEESGMSRDSYSLQSINRSAAEALRFGRKLHPSGQTVWGHVTQLFDFINRGSPGPPLHVATFNGGLFDPERHPFLERCAVGDAHLQEAIDRLARVQGQFIDYRDLSERHLGSIYEGLLEFQLQPLAADDPEDARAAAAGWSVKLVTDKGERKATGSYYTPGYITRFMVERAVGPVVDAVLASTPGGTGETDDPDARAHAVLGINVLDCSMGSGHFLVEATDYIASRLVEADLLPAELKASPGSVTDELAYWKRRVAQTCIYGVDLNPLAVDLAKLSLWLATAAKGRPLSFLDHHLRPGNALVGARLDELKLPAPAASRKGAGRKTVREQREEGGQLTWASDSAFTQSMKLAVDNMWLIEENAALTLQDVKSQEQLYAAVREGFIRKYSRLADLTAATRFGLEVNEALWTPLADYAARRTIAALPQFRQWLEAAETLSREHRFFHWELEFPEVFFDRYGRPLGDAAGFDVVIGNPPYVRQERLAPLKPYLQATFRSYHGVADLYLYFYEQSLRLLRDGGRMAYVSSGTFARANFASAFRKLLPTLGRIETLVDFGENQPFEGAEMVRPSIVVISRTTRDIPFRSLFLAAKVPESLDEALVRDGIDCPPEVLRQPEWTFQAAHLAQLFRKIQRAGRPLTEVVNGRFYYGVKTGRNSAFMINTDTRRRLIAEQPECSVLIKRSLSGEDLRPWYQEDEERWLLFCRRGLAIHEYPPIERYLAGFREELEPRPEEWQSERDGRWPGRKVGSYKWYELQDAVDYYAELERPKIVWPDISKLPRFSLDSRGSFGNDTTFLIPTVDLSLLAILQSRASWFMISKICQPLRLRGGLWQYRLKSQFISRLPIPGLAEEDRTALGDLAVRSTEFARSRYALHQQTRHRLRTDLGQPDKPLNQKLTTWWELDFPGTRTELKKVYQRDIPVAERQEWETWLSAQRAEHERLTREIVDREGELNERVYRLFDLTPEEIRIIEESTQYRYGEV